MLPGRCFLSSNFEMACAQKCQSEHGMLFNWLQVWEAGPLLTYILGGSKPPSPYVGPPSKGFWHTPPPPPSKSPFSLKMCKNHTEIAGNHPGELKNSKIFLLEDPQTTLKSLFRHFFPLKPLSDKSVFVVGSSTEKSALLLISTLFSETLTVY